MKEIYLNVKMSQMLNLGETFPDFLQSGKILFGSPYLIFNQSIGEKQLYFPEKYKSILSTKSKTPNLAKFLKEWYSKFPKAYQLIGYLDMIEEILSILQEVDFSKKYETGSYEIFSIYSDAKMPPQRIHTFILIIALKEKQKIIDIHIECPQIISNDGFKLDLQNISNF